MSPSRPVRLLAPERARRDLPSRPIYPPFIKTAPPETNGAASADTEPASAAADSLPEQKRDRSTRAVLITMIGINFGALLGLVGWPVLQALKLVDPPVIERVQRDQEDSISRLDATVQALNTLVTELHARVTSAGERQEADRARLAEIDLAVGELRTSVHDMRTAQDAARESWRAPVAELMANATKARSDIARLRTALEESKGLRQPEVAALRARLDRIEQAMVQHELLSAMRGSIQAPAREARSLASRAGAPEADGHIMTVSPAQ